jgi:hypothetical protein
MSSLSEPQKSVKARTALRAVNVLVGIYLTLSILAIVTAIVFRNNPGAVNSAVWIRGSIVAVTAALMLRFAIGAQHGNARHYLRLRLSSAIMVVAIAAILLIIPGDFPVWMKIEQATCGVLLVVVAVIANGKRLRSWFKSAKSAEETGAAA